MKIPCYFFFPYLDAESHILFFDIEGLIVELHSEEYAAMSPTTLEVRLYLNKVRNICKQSKYCNFKAQGLLIPQYAAKENVNVDAGKKITGKC